ncbi:MAG: AmmeMemoRadiSam system protein B [Acidobacteriaceae bacterium]|nr:AmmeMemoRadiSam system protein B [Acidobacteriaceae bacterium]MBV9781089.1 AmmeMemoRadiSam system protein B [Acidobacteriaceae bacterium]
MSSVLPRLRFNLDFLPSPDPTRPGLFIRDPYHYSDATLLVPPILVQALQCFDGTQSTLDLRSELVRLTGEIQVGPLEKHLFESLSDAGFLENDTYRELKAHREAEFASEPKREAIFAGSAYPAEAKNVTALLSRHIRQPMGTASTVGIAAPHVSPDGGWNTYRAAYESLPNISEAQNLTFIVLGTSHYGAPERFGVTRKHFITPLGEAQTDVDLVDELNVAAGDAVRMEDYCHAVEHSIEFQILFLQHVYGPSVKILPILCGPFVKSIYEGGLPEENDGLARFLDALGNIYARDGRRLFWVLGVDMTHIGRRYGDSFRAIAKSGEMLSIEERDRERIRYIEAGDALNYWGLVQEKQDDLKWCGASPLYTLLRTVPGLKGELVDYDQWQIDPHSVVTFGAMRFTRS